jgi:hypothetical protein
MKNKKLLVIIFFVSVFYTGMSQNVFPSFADNAKWNVLHCVSGIGNSCNTITYQFDYDTLFCGHIYSKINAVTTGSIGYIRSENSRVYIRTTNSCIDKEYVMYDFSINVGDTIYLANNIWNSNPNDTTKFVLDSINIINFNGIERYIYYVKYEPDSHLWPNWYGRHMIWIEGIGSITNPFFPIECIQDICESSWQLLCFDSLGIQLYQDSIFKTCDTTYTDVRVNEFYNENQLIIYPTPFGENLTISVENATISEIVILNSIGKQIYIIKGNEKNCLRLDALNNLKEGIYFVKVKTNKGILVKKIIKIE